MTLEITVPGLSTGKKSTRDMIVSTLSTRYPLNLAKLTNRIKKDFGVSVTFQGVRKAVSQLVEQGVLIKKGRDYLLSKNWILQLKAFADHMHTSYFSGKHSIKDLQSLGENLKLYTFNDLIDTDTFLNHLIKSWFEKSPRGIYLQLCGHAYFAVGNLGEESKINEVMKDHKIDFYTLAGGKTKLDSWTGNFFKGQGFRYASGAGNTHRYGGVYNDHLFLYETPKTYTKELDTYYSATKDFQTLDMLRLVKILRRTIDVKVTVMKNPMMAEQLRNYILSHFKK